jgi:hypothetical protein
MTKRTQSGMKLHRERGLVIGVRHARHLGTLISICRTGNSRAALAIPPDHFRCRGHSGHGPKERVLPKGKKRARRQRLSIRFGAMVAELSS